MATIWVEFGLAVAKARLAKAIPLGELAQAVLGDAGRSGYVVRIERGRVALHRGTVDRLAQVLDLPDSVTSAVLASDLPAQDAETEVDRRAAALILAAAGLSGFAGDAPPADALMIDLAYDFAQTDHADPVYALNGLSAALQDAAELKSVAQLAVGVVEPVTLVIRHIAALNDLGQRDAAVSALSEALGALQPTHTLVATALNEVALRQDRICNAPTAAAKRLLVQLRAAPHPGGLFRAIHDAWEGWFDRGADRGLTFDLTVALHLARANLERAKGIKHTQALIDLGLTQFRLGEVEGSAPRLTQAVATLRAFLAEHPRKAGSDIWAVAQVNLGVALAALARVDGTAPPLHAAITAFRAALQVQTQTHAPQDWAATSDHLTQATTLLADRPM